MNGATEREGRGKPVMPGPVTKPVSERGGQPAHQVPGERPPELRERPTPPEKPPLSDHHTNV